MPYPNDSPWAKWLVLDDLRRKIRSAKFEELDLTYLQPLKEEVEFRLKEVSKNL